MEALQLGAVQMLAPSLAKFGPLGVKEFEVFDLPYIFDNYADLHKVTQGPVGKPAAQAKLEPRASSAWLLGQRLQVLLGQHADQECRPTSRARSCASSRPRCSKSRSAPLALPQVMAFSEVYQALQTGVVDGTENPHSNLYTQKMHEVQKHLTLTDHGYLGYAVIVNKKFWDGLPADVRGQLDKAMKEATVYANKIAKEENDKALEGGQEERQDRRSMCRRQGERGWPSRRPGAGAQEDGSRIGKEPCSRSTRKPASTRPSSACARSAPNGPLGA
jgi:C4-dicarboxylate-binding protein DctP